MANITVNSASRLLTVSNEADDLLMAIPSHSVQYFRNVSMTVSAQGDFDALFFSDERRAFMKASLDILDGPVQETHAFIGVIKFVNGDYVFVANGIR